MGNEHQQRPKQTKKHDADKPATDEVVHAEPKVQATPSKAHGNQQPKAQKGKGQQQKQAGQKPATSETSEQPKAQKQQQPKKQAGPQVEKKQQAQPAKNQAGNQNKGGKAAKAKPQQS